MFKNGSKSMLSLSIIDKGHASSERCIDASKFTPCCKCFTQRNNIYFYLMPKLIGGGRTDYHHHKLVLTNKDKSLGTFVFFSRIKASGIGFGE